MGRLWFAAVLACVACGGEPDTVVNVTLVVEGDAGGSDAAVTPADSGSDAGTEAEAEAEAAPEPEPEPEPQPEAGVDAAPEAGPLVCGAGQKLCDNGVCVGACCLGNDSPAIGCAGESCEPCARPTSGGATVCVAGQCGFFCETSDRVVKDGDCVQDTWHKGGTATLADCGGELSATCPTSCPANRHCCTTGAWPSGGQCGCWDGVQCNL